MNAAPAWAEAAAALADKVTADAPEWHKPVSSVPRHLLVPRWWTRMPNSPGQRWELVDVPEDSPRRLRTAYSDDTLVTRVGARHADMAEPGERAAGEPTSSSTLPGLIVSMSHRLDARPGDRVLDVGTGSGYSAALFADRFGDDSVTSVDIDRYLVSAAQERLARLGFHPRMEAIDATGELPGSEYERIMATVAVRPVPPSWLRALRPGGRVVTTIAGTALLITADMGDDGTAWGTVQPDPAMFMQTRQTADYPPPLNDVFASAREKDGEDVRPPCAPIPDLWRDWSLRYLFELDTPGVETRSATYPGEDRRITWLLAADGSWARAEDGTSPRVHQGGPRRLWDDLERVSRRWDEFHRFPLHTMRAELNAEGSRLLAPGGSWSFSI